jgi:hypothetical protein
MDSRKATSTLLILFLSLQRKKYSLAGHQPQRVVIEKETRKRRTINA